MLGWGDPGDSDQASEMMCSRMANRTRSAFVFKAKVAHDAVFVKGNCSDGDVEDGCRLLHGMSFCQQLEHLTLTLGEFLGAFPTGLMESLVD